MDQAGEGFGFHLLAQNRDRVVVGVAGVDDDRKTGDVSRLDMGAEVLDLLTPRAVFVVIVEPGLADAALELGFCISVSGIATFKKSDELRAVIKTVPLDRLLVETDAPYLAPMPHRGKRNEPAFVAHTAAMLAALKGVSAQELADVTTENFFRLFTKVTKPI